MLYCRRYFHILVNEIVKLLIESIISYIIFLQSLVIGLVDGLVLNRRSSIIYTNHDILPTYMHDVVWGQQCSKLQIYIMKILS